MASSGSVQKLSLFALTALVVGSMVGSGIFSLPRTFGSATGPFGAIIAWTIAASGMYCRSFQSPSLSRSGLLMASIPAVETKSIPPHSG